MANFGAKILGNAVAALNAQQAVIANTGNNIANVNTEGYTRRTVSLQSRVTSGRSGGISLGNGVEVAGLTRVSNNFLEALVRDGISEKFGFGMEDELMTRVESLFALTGSLNTIGDTMSEFFSSLDTLALNPASLELRADVMARAEDLTTAISETFNGLAAIQQEADERLDVEINSINSLTAEIARLNGLVSGRESAGNVAADERDQRDQLLNQLAEKIGFSVVEASDGTVNVTLEGGFPLVYGVSSRDLELTDNPDWAPGAIANNLAGGINRWVVYDYAPTDPTSGQLDLTTIARDGGGTVGALLTTRGVTDVTDTEPWQASGPLVELASRVEWITRNLLTSFNATYVGPDAAIDALPTTHEPTAIDISGPPNGYPGEFGFFTSSSPLGGGPTTGIAELADLTGSETYSSTLALAFSDPTEIAAGWDIPVAGVQSGSAIEGDARNLNGDGTTLGIAQLQNQLSSAILTTTVGNFTFTGNFDDVYNEAVGRVGNLKSRSLINANVSEENLLVVKNRRDEISAVSLDEEFTQLIRFQKAFEANARMVRTADELLTQILQLL